MMRFLRRATGVTAVALSLVVLTGTAFAGGGNGNSSNAPGQEKKADATQPQAAPATADTAAQPQAQQQQSTPPGQAKKQDGSQTASSGQAKQQARASSATPGVKPSNTTSHHTSCSTGTSGSSVTCTGNGPKADSSKQYGNGKTAAQIAASRGAPAGTLITGPGNSQPHKVVTCGHTHAVDVHAVKSYDTSACQTSTPSPVCTVNCGTAPPTPPCGSSVTSQTTVLGVMHMNGKGRPVHLMTNPKSAHFRPKHGDQPVTQTKYTVVANGDSCGGTHESVTPACTENCSSSNTSDQSGSVLSASPALSASSASAVSSGSNASATPSAGGVLGATANLTAPKPQRGGVLGTVANVAGSTLPFTGFPLWIAVLIAVVLIAAGLMLRGRGSATRI